MSFQSTKGAYPPGEIIQIGGLSTGYPSLELLVNRHAEAWTSFCGMIVQEVNKSDQADQPSAPGKPEEIFLKLFDRRHATDLRSDNCIGLWGQHRERAFIEGIYNEQVDRILCRLHNEPGFYQKTEPHRDYADDEAFLWNESITSFHREKIIYSTLAKHQGDLVPLFLGDVTLDVRPSDFKGYLPEVLFQVRGLLLEHPQGFSLADVANHAPQSSWQGICDKAMNIVRVLNGEGIINRGVAPDQFVVVPEEGGEYRVCLMSLDRCEIREDESDEEWARKKWFAAEEDRLARAMKDQLKGNGDFELRFEPSLK
ncbi:unnamed protein product [Clonostachys solani]|uniref:Uncharacterized protein n=1 Tax=Clonostachys solani TaxID=160281 RepID=A0A9P0EU78_9HYPO|nr:unnamed protein product [Clonostachys solani]